MILRHVSWLLLITAMRLTIGQGKGIFDKEILHSVRLAKKIYYYKEKQVNFFAKNELSNYLQEPISNYSATAEEGNKLKQDLMDFLEGVDDNEDDQKIPDYLMCPITCDLILDPVLLSSGHTYEREEIQKHFSQNGHKDPVTNESVNDKTIDNINLKQAIEDFIKR